MCGIFGAIGANWNQGTIRALAIMNRERGTDSLGFFDSSGRMIKAGCDPENALAQANITTWLNESENGGEKHPISWFIAGHTRQATRGKVNRQNSHPFRYGNIIGCHNGMVDAPKTYTVDSQYLIDTLNKAGGDYNAAWANISGYWGVAWFDGEAFYLQVHNGEIAVGQKDGCYYYSSSKSHLAACIGANDTIVNLKEGQTLKFTKSIMEEATPFVSNMGTTWVRKSYNWDYGYTYKKHGRSKVYYEKDSVDTSVKDYDATWRTAWEEYSTQSEHSYSE